MRLYDLFENNIINFPDRKAEIFKDKISSLPDDFYNAMGRHQDNLYWVQRKIGELEQITNKAKFRIPFVMKEFKKGTDPVYALSYALDDVVYLRDDEYSEEQKEFLFQFVTEHKKELLYYLNKKKREYQKLIEYIRTELDETPGLKSYLLRPISYKTTELHHAINDIEKYSKLTESVRTQEQLQPFKLETTNMPLYDNMMENPDYFEREKGMAFDIVWMMPGEYIHRCVVGFGRTGLDDEGLLQQRQKSLAEKYAREMKKGDRFPLPVLDYTRGSFSQEGLHRAWAAKMLGITKMPVLIVTSSGW